MYVRTYVCMYTHYIYIYIYILCFYELVASLQLSWSPSVRTKD